MLGDGAGGLGDGGGPGWGVHCRACDFSLAMVYTLMRLSFAFFSVCCVLLDLRKSLSFLRVMMSMHIKEG